MAQVTLTGSVGYIGPSMGFTSHVHAQIFIGKNVLHNDGIYQLTFLFIKQMDNTHLIV